MLNKSVLKIIKNRVSLYMHMYLRQVESERVGDGRIMRAHAHGCCGGERERAGREEMIIKIECCCLSLCSVQQHR